MTSTRRTRLSFLAAAAALGLSFAACGDGGDAVVLYSSVDQDQFQPVVDRFRKSTGVEVSAVGETEAQRSVGMAKKLELEKDHPVASLFWANEIMNTVALRDLGVFAPLPAGVAEQFPPAWRDKRGRYVAFAGRARVLLVNTRLLPDRKDWPTSVADLLDSRWGGEGRRCAVGQPLTGTTYTHAVVILTKERERGQAFWKAVAERASKGEVRALPGNGPVARQVADPSNGVAWGITDTDDARDMVTHGHPVDVVYPDQEKGNPGTLVIPNTVALVEGGPKRKESERFLRWLASTETEAALAAGDIANIPLRDDVPAPPHVKRPGKDFRAMEVDWDEVGKNRDRWQGLLQSLFTAK